MTEVRALVAFTEKESGVFFKKGDTLSVSEERASELAEKKAVEILAAPAKEKKTAKSKK